MPRENFILSAYEPLSDQGFCLPCYNRARLGNEWFFAVCEPSGDSLGRISGFRSYLPGELRRLPEDDHRSVSLNDPWLDVFLWDGKAYLGTPIELWQAIRGHLHDIEAEAPLSLFDLALDIEKAPYARLAKSALRHLESLGLHAARNFWLNNTVPKKLRKLAHRAGVSIEWNSNSDEPQGPHFVVAADTSDMLDHSEVEKLRTVARALGFRISLSGYSGKRLKVPNRQRHAPRETNAPNKFDERQAWRPSRGVFISSVQSEFAAERIAVRDFIRGDTLLSRYFDVFVFEDAPAQTAGLQQVYLDEVDACSVYIGLFGEQYGYQDSEGVSPTEREFSRAVQKRKERLVFLKEGSKDARHPKMAALVKKVEAQHAGRSFFGIPDLNSLIKASLLLVLENDGLLHEKPFELRIADAKGKSIDKGLVDDFVERASAAGKLRLKRGSKPADVLRHLGILDDNGASYAAVLLFSKEPARFIPGARVTCIHYSGAEPRRPALSQKVYEGPLFEQIEQSIEFLSSHLDRRGGTRGDGGAMDTPLEIPVPAIAEAVVNALVHRDYQSNAPTQVLLFVDRVEIRNPGELVRSLTPEQLRRVHSSIPRNARIADVLFRINFVDRAGAGTLDMIAQCRDAGLPEPEFFQDGDQWVVRIWRDHWKPDTLQKHGLSERQIVGVLAGRTIRRVTTQGYMEATRTTRPLAKRDLEDLVQRGFLRATGAGRGAAYEFDHQWLKNGSNGSSSGDA